MAGTAGLAGAHGAATRVTVCSKASQPRTTAPAPRRHSWPARATTNTGLGGGFCLGGGAGAHSRALLSCAAAAATPGNGPHERDATELPPQAAAPPSPWAPMPAAVAKMLPWVACAGFGVYLMRSNLALGLGAALRSADVLVVAALGGVGLALGRYLESVSKRFDVTDAAVSKRFDATDAAVSKRFDATDAALREVKKLLQARRA